MDLTYVHTNNGVGNMFARVTALPFENSQTHKFEHIDYDAPDYYYEITGMLWNQNEDNDKKKCKNIIDRVHTINYKYIKNLSLAVSDAISRVEGTKKCLYDAFSKQHPALFSSGENSMNELDGLIIMLMIEESPTRVLEVIFSYSPQLFYDVVKNIDNRFDDDTLSFHRKPKAELSADVEKLIKERLLIGEHNIFRTSDNSSKLKTDKKRLRPMAQALLIVSALLRLVEEDCQNEYIYAGNIYANIETLSSMKKVSDSSLKVEYVKNILIDTFKHLICFYEGVFAYGGKKGYFDVEAMNTCLSRNRIAEIQKNLLDEFMKAAKKRADSFKKSDRYDDSDVMVYIDDFISLCKRCYETKADERSDREKLYSAIGKYEILDLEVFYNCFATQIGDLKTINAETVDRWIDFALIIMEYLKTGSFADTPIDYNLMNAIYPFAAAYSKRNTNRDGHTTVTFTISIDIDNNGTAEFRREINVLTEFNYNLQEVFYCLPNVQRSNDRWWIDPLLISFTNFNSIFDD